MGKSEKFQKKNSIDRLEETIETILNQFGSKRELNYFGKMMNKRLVKIKLQQVLEV